MTKTAATAGMIALLLATTALAEPAPRTAGTAPRAEARTYDLPPPDRRKILAGGSSLYKGPKGEDLPTLAEQIDGCLYQDPAGGPPAGVTRDPFSCVAVSARMAARQYRRLAGVRSWESEAFTASSTFGFSGLAIALRHSAKDTISVWSALALGPIISDDIASPGPRAKLYNVAATAMTVTTVRAEAMREALAATRLGFIENGRAVTLQEKVSSACSGARMAQIDALPLAATATPAETQAQAKARDLFSAQARARCNELVIATQNLAAAGDAWSSAQNGFARGLAVDATNLDDKITALDRQTLAPPRATLTVVLNAALNLPAKLTGTAAPPEYTGRNLPVFTSTYTFNLMRVRDVDLPGPVAADLTAPPGLDTTLGERSTAARDLNILTAQLNQAIAAGADFKTINDRSILSVSPGQDQPVTITSPTRP